ncbi:MAG: EamA family transporter [Pseudomonadota bacterium]|nr:EamA family transporter [Pseudomonadota bacterium]
MISLREVTSELHILEAVLFRCLSGVVFMVPWLVKMGKTGSKTSQPTLVITRGVLACFVSGFYFLAATLVSLTDMVSITFTRPEFGVIAPILVLHEVAHARR